MSFTRKILITFLFISVAAVAFFYQPLTSLIIDHSLQIYLKHKFNADFHVEHIRKDAENWVLEKVSLTRFTECKEQIKADQVFFTCDFLVKDIRFDFKIAVKNGEISLADAVHPERNFVNSFDLAANIGQTITGNAILRMASERHQDNLVECSFSIDPKGNKLIYLNTDSLECSCVNPALHLAFPYFNQYELDQGYLNGNLTLALSPQNDLEFDVKELHVRNLSLNNSSMGLHAEFPEIKVNFSETVDFELLQPATCQVKSENESSYDFSNIIGKINWPITEPSSVSFSCLLKKDGKDFPITLSNLTEEENGKVLFETRYSELKATILLDLTSENLFIQARGTGKELLTVIPSTLGANLQDHINTNQVTIDATVSKTEIVGILKLSEDKSQEEDDILFGLNFEASPASLLNLKFKNGWFEAKHLQLDKYASALFVRNDGLKFTGWGDFKGDFDLNSLVLHYDTKDFSLSNEYFVLDCNKLSEIEDEQNNGSWPAVHYFDLITGNHGGYIPLKNARYYEKNSGLLFTDISTRVILGLEGMYASGVEAFYKGIYLAGDLEINYANHLNNHVDVFIYANTMQGNNSNVQELISHFNQTEFLKSPFEGNFSLRNTGGYLHFSISPEGIDTEAHVFAAFSDGKLKFLNADIALHDLSANIEYDYKDKQLAFTDIQGTMLVGSPDHVEEYAFSGDRLIFNDHSMRQSDFDFWVGDKNRDILRVVGKTTPLDDPAMIELSLDHHLSHFGNVHPDLFKIIVKDGRDIEEFKVKFEFQLSSLLKDLQRFSRTGLLLLSRSFLQELNDIKNAEGKFKVNILYDQKSELDFDVTSQGFVSGKHQFNECFFKGKKRGNAWTIDQLQLDTLCFAADLIDEKDYYDVKFLGIRYGQSLLLGMSGKYNPDENTLNGQINLLEIDVEHLNEWSKLSDFVEKFHPKGLLRGTGPINISLAKGKPGWSVETTLNSTLQKGGMEGVSLRNSANFICVFESDRGITLSNLKTAILDASKKNQEIVSLELGKFDYNLLTHDWEVTGLKFDVPSSQLPIIVAQAENIRPDIFNSDLALALKSIKSDGFLNGSLDISSCNQTVRLDLPKGEYNFNGKIQNVDQISVICNPYEGKTFLKCDYEGNPYWLSVSSKLPNFGSGEFSISLLPPLEQDKNDAIKIKWVRDSTVGFGIQNIEGECAGVKTSLVSETDAQPGFINLAGDIEVDSARALLLPKSIRTLIQDFGLVGNFKVTGNWKTKKLNPFFFEDLVFSGAVKSDQCLIKGYQCTSLFAFLDGTAHQLLLRDVRLKDAAGNFAASNIDIFMKDEKNFEFKIPSIIITEWRPNLMGSNNEQNVISDNPFVIRELKIENLEGNILNPQTIMGNGSGSFVNPMKRDQSNSILTIPSELLNSTGLDLNILSPVTGTILFKIADQKIYLTKFKDMYSAGKLSKFYLPKKSANPSYIDFEGNLFVQVRMKQSSLLFKLAELFTVTIAGSINEPKYSIMKSKD